MKIRLKNQHNIIGCSHTFNTYALNEVMVCLDDYDCGSFYINDIQILIYGLWLDLTLAFRNNDVITDNYNTKFFKPLTYEDKKRGFTLY